MATAQSIRDTHTHSGSASASSCSVTALSVPSLFLLCHLLHRTLHPTTASGYTRARVRFSNPTPNNIWLTEGENDRGGDEKTLLFHGPALRVVVRDKDQ